VTAEKLIYDYTLDDTTAAGTYGGKTYIISGIISSYIAGASPPTLTLINKTDDVVSITCAFDGSQTDITSLTIGQSVRIEGRISTNPLMGGNTINVNRCVVIQ